MTSLTRWKGSAFLLVPVIAGLICTGFPMGPARSYAAEDVPLTITPVGAQAIDPLLDSLKTVVNNAGGINAFLPPNLQAFLNNGPAARQAAEQLGKALFWDMAIGADGMACASCHFHAGADNRVKNQLSPDFQRIQNQRQDDVKGYHFAGGDPDFLFQLVDPADTNPALPNKGPNYTLQADDFPFVKDIGTGDASGANVVLSNGGLTVGPNVADGNTNDVASSQGNFLTTFISVDPFGLATPEDLTDDVLGSDNIRDAGTPVADVPNFDDPALGVGFQVDGKNVRRVEPRNTPTMINAVFNLHNFWDGRANTQFNGVNPFGQTDRNAKIFVSGKKSLAAQTVSMKNASLASQAVGPPLSPFEMSFTFGTARIWPDVGHKMVNRYLLATQDVDTTDSVLGGLRLAKGAAPVMTGKGINTKYSDLIKAAFKKNLWDSSFLVAFPQASITNLEPNNFLFDPGPATIVTTAKQAKALAAQGVTSYTQMEANFSFFFGVAVMLYEASLWSGETPFDKWMEANQGVSDRDNLRTVDGFGELEQAGLQVFLNQGKCINCHGGAEFTNASLRHTQFGANLIEPMIMGDGNFAFYDGGFYNIGVTPTTDDRGRGGLGPEGKPLSSSRQFLFKDNNINGPINFPIIGEPIMGLIARNPLDTTGDGIPDQQELFAVDEATGQETLVCIDLNMDGKCSAVVDDIVLQRVAVDGAFKASTVRNIELTGPYFHNGGFKTLREVVAFYDRGGNFCRFNFDDLDPDIQGLGLDALTVGGQSAEEALVAFMIALTDDRVRYKQAPFDHPELRLPNGHPTDEDSVTPDALFDNKQAIDSAPIILPAVGATGVNEANKLKAFHTIFGGPFVDGIDGHLQEGTVVGGPCSPQ
jgi:cytochrome c peroxidase